MSFSLANDTHPATLVSAVGNTIPATTVGNLLIVAITNATTGASPVSVSSITGGGVGTWVKGGQFQSGGTSNYDAEVWYGIVTSATGNTSVTINYSLSVAQANITEFSWSGGSLVGSGITVEAGTAGTNGHTAAGTAITSGVITPSSGRDALIVCTWGRNGTATTKTSGPTNSFTELAGASGAHTAAYLSAPSTSGSYSVSWAYSNNYAVHNAVIVAMSIGGSPPPTVNSNFFEFF